MVVNLGLILEVTGSSRAHEQKDEEGETKKAIKVGKLSKKMCHRAYQSGVAE